MNASSAMDQPPTTIIAMVQPNAAGWPAGRENVRAPGDAVNSRVNVGCHKKIEQGRDPAPNDAKLRVLRYAYASHYSVVWIETNVGLSCADLFSQGPCPPKTWTA